LERVRKGGGPTAKEGCSPCRRSESVGRSVLLLSRPPYPDRPAGVVVVVVVVVVATGGPLGSRPRKWEGVVSRVKGGGLTVRAVYMEVEVGLASDVIYLLPFTTGGGQGGIFV
jgi:hypothetical protein